MTFKDFIKKQKEKRIKSKEEKEKQIAASKTFADIIKKRELQIKRQAFEKETLKQAELKGKQIAIARANRPTFVQRLGGASRFVAKKSIAFADRATAPKRRTPVRRRVVRRTPVRRRVVRRTPIRFTELGDL